MITGSFEYNRPVRIVRQTGGREGTPSHYDVDLTQTHLDFELQDHTTGEFYPDITASIVPTIIGGPVGGITQPEGSGHYSVIEFTLPKPAEVPSGSCWIVEWNTNDYDALDYFEFEVLDKTSDEVYIENLPFA
jgi:hypothetical protein